MQLIAYKLFLVKLFGICLVKFIQLRKKKDRELVQDVKDSRSVRRKGV